MIANSEVLLTIHQFNKLYTKVMNEVAKSFDMTRVEIDILLFLYNNPKYDSAKDIVELRGIAKSYVSKGIELLKEKEYLLVEEDQHDRRLSHLHIQSSAIPLILDAKKSQDEVFYRLLQGISPQELANAQKIINKIQINLKEEK